MKYAVLMTIVGCVALSTVRAEASGEKSEAMDALSDYTDAALAPIDLVQEDVMRQVEDYLNGPVAAQFAEPGVHLESGTATVNVSTDHRDWAKHRVLAYKVAWAQVQEKFIRYQMPEISTELIRKLYADASGSVPEYVPQSYTGSDTIDEFIDKSGAYLSGRLDAALSDIGVDPDEYSRGTKKQRSKLLEDAIQQETVSQSVGKLTGLWPLMSFTGTVNDQHAVGVVGIYKPQFEEVATEIANGRIPYASATKRGRPIAERVTSKDKASLFNSFGIRLLRDEHGYPVLISFGQWSVTSNNPNPAIRAKFRDAAIKQARAQADAELALFLNGSANFENRSLVGSVIEEYIDVDRSGFNAAGSNIQIQDVIDEVLKARGRVKLPGLRDLRTWMYRHPETGHDIVGVVRIWTPRDAMAAAEIRSGPRVESTPRGEASQTSSDDQSELRRSSAESPAYADPDEW